VNSAESRLPPPVPVEALEKADRRELRDRFALAALSGLVANPMIRINRELADAEGLTDAEAIAKSAFLLADAMLKESEK
jgi:hypothetical protein